MSSFLLLTQITSLSISFYWTVFALINKLWGLFNIVKRFASLGWNWMRSALATSPQRWTTILPVLTADLFAQPSQQSLKAPSTWRTALGSWNTKPAFPSSSSHSKALKRTLPCNTSSLIHNINYYRWGKSTPEGWWMKGAADWFKTKSMWLCCELRQHNRPCDCTILNPSLSGKGQSVAQVMPAWNGTLARSVTQTSHKYWWISFIPGGSSQFSSWVI